ncbi:MAG: PepSY-associated TM helix domain-containing protein [Novosphingobium sp.]
MRTIFVRLHRWVSLVLAAFWLIQAITGTMIVFHWEMTEAAYTGAHRATDTAGLARRIASIEADPAARVESLWTTAGLADRYTLFVSDGRAVQVAGDGTELVQQSSWISPVVDRLVVLHQSLLAGDVGEWIVGISGILLASNLLLGLCVAWPQSGGVWRTMRPSRRGPPAARTYSWHRALGLWVAVPAFVIVVTGTLLRFEDGTGRLVGYASPSSSAITAHERTPIPFDQAANAALATIPGATLVSASMPSDDDATYRFRLREPGEAARAYGKSEVFVNALDGKLVGVFPESTAEPSRRFMDTLFALHTGEAGGPVGRVLVLLIGIWLATMIVLGVVLWQGRRKWKGTLKRVA